MKAGEDVKCANCGDELPNKALCCPSRGTPLDTGRQKCRILKQIRQRIADENDIPYVTRDCRFRGECTGTCPKCEAELRYLEQELEKQGLAGKEPRVAGLYPDPLFGKVPHAAGDDMPVGPDPGKEEKPGPASRLRSPELAGVPARPPQISLLRRLWSRMPWSKERGHD